MHRRAPHFWCSDAGGVAPIAGLAIFAFLALAALVVDGGSMFLYSRKLQGAADLAAMSAADRISGHDASRQPQATAIAEAVTLDNMGTGIAVKAVYGGYRPDPSIAPDQRFVAGVADPDAVRVTLRGEAPVFFAALFLDRDALPVSRTATAARARMAAFSIGTRLAALEGGVANALLSSLTGSEVRLSVADYNALARADVDLLMWNRALGRRLNLEAASYDDVLQARSSVDDGIGAMVDVLDSSDVAAKRALQSLAASADGVVLDRLGDLVDLGPIGSSDRASSALSTKVDALSMVTAMLETANKDRQLRLGADGDLGVARTQIWLAIGERPNNSPWFTVTNHGEPIIRTAQMRLYAVAQADALGLGRVRLPVFAEAAPGEARLSDIRCGGSPSVTLDVRPGVAKASVADIDTGGLDDFKRPMATRRAALLSTALISASASAHVQAGGDRWKPVTFSKPEIDNGMIKTVSTSDIAEALLSHLIGDLDLDVRVLGLGIGLGKSAIQQALAQTLGTLGAVLDGQLETVFALTGVRLGQADVRVGGVRCGAGVLVG